LEQELAIFFFERMAYKAAGYADLCSCKITEYKALEHPFLKKGKLYSIPQKKDCRKNNAMVAASFKFI
jgi:hypothetical protein